MKKMYLCVIVIVLISNLFSLQNFAGIFTLINPSATDVAFGNDSGAANIWNRSPLSIWSNPAKLGYHRGLSFGYSDDPYFEEAFDDMYNRTSYLSLGWKGIGILIPAPTAKSRYGNVMYYGLQEYIDEQGNEGGIFESYDSCTKFAIGFNTIEFMANFIDNEKMEDLTHYGDISFGYSYDYIYSKLFSGISAGVTSDYVDQAEAHSMGFGLIGRLSPFNTANAAEKFYRLDLTGGVYFLNPSKTEVEYNDNSQRDPLPYGTRSAFSAKLSIDLNILPALDNKEVRSFINNIFSFYYSQDNAQYGEKNVTNPSTWGEGFELTFFDFFSYRKGQFINKMGEVIGDTEGYSFNLSYQEIIQLQYNKVSFPGGGLQSEQEKSDFMIRVELLKTYDRFFK